MLTVEFAALARGFEFFVAGGEDDIRAISVPAGVSDRWLQIGVQTVAGKPAGIHPTELFVRGYTGPAG